MPFFRRRTNEKTVQDGPTPHLSNLTNTSVEPGVVDAHQAIFSYFKRIVDSFCSGTISTSSGNPYIPNGDQIVFMVVSPDHGYVFDSVYSPIGNKASFFSSKYAEKSIAPDEPTVGLHGDYAQAEEARQKLMEDYAAQGFPMEMRYQAIDLQTACDVIKSLGANVSLELGSKKILIPLKALDGLTRTIEERESSLNDIPEEVYEFANNAGINIIDSDIIFHLLSPIKKVFDISMGVSCDVSDPESTKLEINVRERNIPYTNEAFDKLDLLKMELEYQVCGINHQLSGVNISTGIHELPIFETVTFSSSSLNREL